MAAEGKKAARRAARRRRAAIITATVLVIILLLGTIAPFFARAEETARPPIETVVIN